MAFVIWQLHVPASVIYLPTVLLDAHCREQNEHEDQKHAHICEIRQWFYQRD